VFVAIWATTALLALRPVSLSLIYPDHVPLDAAMIGYCIALSLLTAALFGVTPAVRATRMDPASGMQLNRPRSGGVVRGRWLFSGIVALETALTIVLLVAASLLVTSFLRLQGVEPGFDPANLVEMTVKLDSEVYPDPAQRRDFFRRLAQRVGGLRGIIAVTIAADAPPHNRMMIGPMEREDQPSASPTTMELARAHIAPDYFRVLRIPLLDGRTLAEEDALAEDQVVVSESFAQRFWPGRSAIGERFRLRGDEGWMRIVGVVGNVAGRGLRGESDEIYFSYQTDRAERSVILARTDMEPSQYFETIKEQVWSLDPNLPIARIDTMRNLMARTIDDRRFYATLMGSFAFTALVLAVIGVFGAALYAARQRTREIGIRVALGAQARDIERMLIIQSILPSLLGIAVGLVGALAFGQVLSSLVYGVSVTDPATLLSAAVAVAAVSLVATWIPARRAGRADPLVTLADE
jgi:predicted permease